MHTALAVIDDPVEELRSLEAELLRRRYRQNPDFWVESNLREQIWSGQRNILHSVRDYRRTAVKSCHEIGKSFIVARVIGWWIDTLPLGSAFAVTSAPTAPQVEAILWREFGRVHAKGNLPGRLNQTEWWFSPAIGKDEMIAFGRKPADTDPTAFQGIHAPYVLVVFDEAGGIPHELWEAADSLIANDNSKIVVIGNPDDPTTRFAEVCRPGSGYNVIEIGAFDTPNFTGESMPQDVLNQLIGRTYVEEKRKQWAPNWTWQGNRCVPPNGVDPQDTDPLWQSKVLGKFPKIGAENGLIPEEWIRLAQQRNLPACGENQIGVDVGGGGDSSTAAHRVGQRVRIVWENHNPDTMQTCGLAISTRKELDADVVKVDMIGIGRGVIDRALELREPFEGIDVGEEANGTDDQGRPNKDFYINRRAQLWWYVRSLFESGDIDIDALDADLARELSEIRFKRLSNGKIQIESKLDAKKRGVRSPNRADAVMLAFAPSKEVQTEATWGRKRHRR